ncbi:hypothetical protein DYB37_009433 [Aphanomyces astaci]|uniref:Uncharacterized protein n=1 Tax=Aphanomyces astaci TaxID=112090 RepID=A0A3L6VEY6_APHAT|nr:hypothetical protein DYB35_007878 [Aphanomyces astaci]RHZ27737.1 hypothetical protein DYB37_009433 [Aphanomyces astaci]RLO07289.1 hypothetical protein DYB28_002398 [Aphanomyces astaci]
MRPRGSRSDTDLVREAIQDAIQQRVHALEFAGDDKISHETNRVCSSLREDVVSVACRVLDHVPESLDTTDARLQLQFVRRMLSKVTTIPIMTCKNDMELGCGTRLCRSPTR